MPNVVFKHPAVQLDIMILKQYWPSVASLIEQSGCHYKQEMPIENSKGHSYIIIQDIQSGYGHALGDLLGALYSLELEGQKDEELKKLGNKFYILIKPKKRRIKKDVQENRPENDEGSESGAGREPAGDIQSGEVDGDCGGCVGNSGSDGDCTVLPQETETPDDSDNQ